MKAVLALAACLAAAPAAARPTPPTASAVVCVIALETIVDVEVGPGIKVPVRLTRCVESCSLDLVLGRCTHRAPQFMAEPLPRRLPVGGPR